MEITAQDFIRALERTANPDANVGGYSFYYSVIEGFDDFAAGDAEEISGLSAPDDADARDHHDLTGRRHELPAGHGHRIADPAR